MSQAVKSLLKSTRKSSTWISFGIGFVLVLLMGVTFIVGSLFFRRSVEKTDTATTQTQLGQKPDSLYYQVSAGDSTWRVAENFYGCGQAYTFIEQQNHLLPDQWLEIGQLLELPRLSDLEKAELCMGQMASEDPESSQPQQTTHQVEAGDNLWDIAEQTLGEGYLWTTIYQQNIAVIGSSPDCLAVDTELVYSTPAESSWVETSGYGGS